MRALGRGGDEAKASAHGFVSAAASRAAVQQTEEKHVCPEAKT